MRRLFVLVLALLLPFQLAWAGAAAYCQHEGQHESQYETQANPARAQVRHFGHHSHEHQAADGAKAGSASKLAADSDCGVCHALGASLLDAGGAAAWTALPAPALVATGPDPHASATPKAPDRPQWPCLAR